MSGRQDENFKKRLNEILAQIADVQYILKSDPHTLVLRHASVPNKPMGKTYSWPTAQEIQDIVNSLARLKLDENPALSK